MGVKVISCVKSRLSLRGAPFNIRVLVTDVFIFLVEYCNFCNLFVDLFLDEIKDESF